MDDEDGCVDAQLFSLDAGTKWWKLQVPETVSPNSYLSFKFSFTATISSLSIVRKVIPSKDDF